MKYIKIGLYIPESPHTLISGFPYDTNDILILNKCTSHVVTLHYILCYFCVNVISQRKHTFMKNWFLYPFCHGNNTIRTFCTVHIFVNRMLKLKAEHKINSTFKTLKMQWNVCYRPPVWKDWPTVKDHFSLTQDCILHVFEITFI